MIFPMIFGIFSGYGRTIPPGKDTTYILRINKAVTTRNIGQIEIICLQTAETLL